jgi:transcriptional regulator with XRE-family HTH domain
MTFSERLKCLRGNYGHSQQMLARKLHEINKKVASEKQVISQYERNARQPTIESLIALAAIFNVSTDYLLCLEEVTEMTETKLVFPPLMTGRSAKDEQVESYLDAL